MESVRAWLFSRSVVDVFALADPEINLSEIRIHMPLDFWVTAGLHPVEFVAFGEVYVICWVYHKPRQRSGVWAYGLES